MHWTPSPIITDHVPAMLAAHLRVVLISIVVLVPEASALDKRPQDPITWDFVVSGGYSEGWQIVEKIKQVPEKTEQEHGSSGHQKSMWYDQVANTLHESDAFLAAVRSGSLEKEAEAHLKKLHEQQRLLFVCARRISSNFVKEVIASQERNVASVGLDPKKAYEAVATNEQDATYFGKFGQHMPCAYFKSLIELQLRNQATTEKRRLELRQLGYVFASELAKQEYDLYRADDLQGLERLRLTKPQKKLVEQQINGVLSRIGVVGELHQQLTRVSTAIPDKVVSDNLIHFD
ncbi:hypothetical protein JST99_05400 [Candidatus Dependentiae bacterium]|nr:hypothetical protein [Candidatus Dependentiae bacterium]